MCSMCVGRYVLFHTETEIVGSGSFTAHVGEEHKVVFRVPQDRTVPDSYSITAWDSTTGKKIGGFEELKNVNLVANAGLYAIFRFTAEGLA